MKRTLSGPSILLLGWTLVVQAAAAPDRGVATGLELAASEPGLRLEYENRTPASSTKTISFRLRLIHDGEEPLALSDITLRYWFRSPPGGEDRFACDWAQVGTGAVHGRFLETTHGRALEIGFTTEALVASWLGGDGTRNLLLPGAETGGIHVRIHDVQWRFYDQSEHHSWDPSLLTFAEHERVTVYVRGERVWGVPPLDADDEYARWVATVFTPEQLADPAISGPDADPDGDGMTNEEERIAGTNPLDPHSALDILAVETAEDGAVVLEWSSAPGRCYTVWSAPTPRGPFTPVRANVPASAPRNRKALERSSSEPRQMFYRVSVALPAGGGKGTDSCAP